MRIFYFFISLISVVLAPLSVRASECQTISGRLPDPKVMMESYSGCAAFNEETFEEATPESFCKCQEDVFALVRSSMSVTQLAGERHYHLGSLALKEGFHQQTELLSELSEFERLYSLEEADKFNCHLKKGIDDALANCAKRGDEKAFLARFLGDYYPEQKAHSEQSKDVLVDKMLGLQLGGINQNSQKALGCFSSQGEVDSLLTMMGEMILDSMRQDFISNKEKILANPQTELQLVFLGALKDKNPNYQLLIPLHPFVGTLNREPSLAADFIDWLEKHPNDTIEDLYSGKSKHSLAVSQKNYYQEKCNQSLEKMSAGLKEGVCQENLVQLSADPDVLVADESGDWMKKEAHAASYCKAGDTAGKTVLNLESQAVGETSKRAELRTQIASDTELCSRICEGEAQVGEACEQKDIETLKAQITAPECQGAFDCLEVKALVRVRERIEKRQQTRLALGLGDSTPDSVVGRILVDQGMEPAEVARSTNAIKKTRKSNLLGLPQEKMAQKSALKPVAEENSQEPNFIKDLASNISDAFKPKESEYDPSFNASETAQAASEAKKSSFTPEKRELSASEKKSDEEAIKFRKALSELEELSAENQRELAKMGTQIPYANNEESDDEKMLGESFTYDREKTRPIPYADPYRAPGYERFVDGPRNPVAAELGKGAEAADSIIASAGALGDVPLAGEGANASTGRVPSSVSGAEAGEASGDLTESIRFNLSELDQLSSELVESRGLADEEDFVLEVVMDNTQKVVIIPVKKGFASDGSEIWEPQLTKENREYFEKVLEIPLFKDFKRQLIDSHFAPAKG